MERRDFLKFAFGFAAGAGAIAAAASAASAAPMLAPHQDLMNGPKPEPDAAAQPAVADQDDLARGELEQVRYHHRHHRHRHHHRRHWHRRRHWHHRRW
ncbi:MULTISPECIES: twin-arginine translocation (Tat) [unclassified Afipia]|uniref:twin-arginine translocation (Tat) n=1 Tax=unclassified Afipia TaxID=2642050 RepID=UPI0009DF19A2|nr:MULTISPECIES: twin-arginine translocation (Tat) [unclassified Afipia]